MTQEIPAIRFILTLLFAFTFHHFLINNAQAQGHPIENFMVKVRSGQLPEWCMYTQTFAGYHSDKRMYNELYEKYVRAYGTPWTAIHHYCYGLDKLNRAFSNWNDEQQRRHLLGSSVSEFDYVLARSDSQFGFKPEIFVTKGRALSALGNYAEAIIAFQSAIRLRPNYVGGYMLIADQFILLGDKDKARTILRVGLTHVPDSPALKKKLDQIE